MKALTLHQPWAWAVVAGHKTVENRSWRPRSLNVGEQLAIHAGHGGSVAEFTNAASYLREEHGLEVPTVLPIGAIIGACIYVGYLPPAAESRGWHDAGLVGWLPTAAVEFPEPMWGVTGHQSLWHVSPAVATKVLQRIDAVWKLRYHGE